MKALNTIEDTYEIVVEGCDSLHHALMNLEKCLRLSVSRIDDMDKSRGSDYIGVLCGGSKSSILRNQLIRLLNSGCCSIILMWDDVAKWANTGWADDTDGVVCRCSASIGILLNALKSLRAKMSDCGSPMNLAKRSRLLRRLQAEALYEKLRVYSHNSNADITNRFLAPARMLLVLNDEDAQKAVFSAWNYSGKKLFNDFKNQVCGAIKAEPPLYGELGHLLCLRVDELSSSLEQNNPKQLQRLIEQLMELVTECRSLAQASTPCANVVPSLATPNEPYTPIPPDEKLQRRILVIDDDVESWFAVLDRLAGRLGPDVDVHVSKDFAGFATRLKDRLSGSCPKQPVLQSLADYDLILLDIYLDKQSATGIRWLSEIRTRILHVPILLWTTSTDRDLPAQASLANGYIFKKSATIDDIEKTIRTWLDAGRSQRLWSLPHPFFDHALRTPEIRVVALAFTKWTLRYMDCFHAVDHFYFRYFNDHGGRHILGILDVASKLLRPFLFAPEDNSPLSLNKDIREKQICCLYLAVLCHEFGMFPIVSHETGSLKEFHGQSPSGDEAWNTMEAMRKLHAVRGMLMLHSNDTSATTYDVRGLSRYQVLAKEAVGEDGWATVAVLVGYHQRCLTLTSTIDDDYLKEDRLATANDPPNVDKSAGKTLDECAGKYNGKKAPNGDLPDWLLKRQVFTISSRAWQKANANNLFSVGALRRLCALMRFADALDVDHTRVPAEFLLDDKTSRRPYQEMEDAKRQVVEDVAIDSGRISFKFSVEEPSETTETTLMALIMKGVAFWSSEEAKGLTMDSKDREGIAGIHSPGEDQLPDGWLMQYGKPWPQRNKPVGSDSDIEKILKTALLIYTTCTKYRVSSVCLDVGLTERAVSTAAAVLALLEVEDEYRAIKEVGMQDVIQLSSVKWSKTNAAMVPSVLRRPA